MDVGRVELVLLIASVVAIVARRLKLPYTVGLLIVGIALGAFRAWPDIPISKEVIFDTLLPPLVFEAALAIKWPRLRRDLALIAVMATAGVIVATAIAAFGMLWLVGWDWRAAFLFASLIAATDPVSVIAMMKDAKVGGRIRLLLEAESLMNDGTGAAMFAVALAALTAGTLSAGLAVWNFVYISIGGALIGGMFGFGCAWLMGRISDHLVEVSLSTVAAWGSFLLAERLGVSGVLGTMAAGLVIGNYGPLAGLSAKGRESSETFWEFVAFVANSFVFLMIGVKLAGQSYAGLWLPATIAVFLVLLGRAVSVFGCSLAFSKTSHKVPRDQQLILLWGGLRGALALSLALGLPDTMPNYRAVMAVTFLVVAFSVVVQGTTVKPLLKRART